MADVYDRAVEAYEFLNSYQGSYEFVLDVRRWVDQGKFLTDKQIDALLRVRDKMDKEPTPNQEPTAVEPGIYFHDGRFYRVQKGKSSGRPYAKRINISRKPKRDDNGKLTEPAQVEFVYTPGMVFRIRPEERLTQEQAKSFGLDFGVCIRCGAVLTVEDSIDRMMGPVCFKKEFG